MTGCQLWGGTLCGPVGTTREASNMVQSGFPVPPLHVHCAPLLMENAPELLALKESTPSCPVMLRISSRPQAPASRSWPSTQARKRARLFENSIGLNGFSAGLRPFRNWALGQGREAGSWGRDEIRNIYGQVGEIVHAESSNGAFKYIGQLVGRTYVDGVWKSGIIYMEASQLVPTGPMNVPPHNWQPVILYLGLPK